MWSAEQVKLNFTCPRSRLTIWSRERVRPPRPASACSFSTPRLNLVLTRGIPPDFGGGVHLYTAIHNRASPEFIGSRKCVLTLVRRHRANSSRGIHSSSNRCCLLQVTTDQLEPNVRLSFPTSTFYVHECECSGHVKSIGGISKNDLTKNRG